MCNSKCAWFLVGLLAQIKRTPGPPPFSGKGKGEGGKGEGGGPGRSLYLNRFVRVVCRSGKPYGFELVL